MPLEIYEIYEKPSPIRISVFLVNLAIVVYLIFKLRQAHEATKQEKSGNSVRGE